MSSSLSDAEIKDKIERSIQIAVNKTGFGRFNWKVMLLSYLICLNTALSISGVGFILPLAECDFQMNTLDKSRISSMQIFGMICGSYFWGCFASLKGRKIALLTSLLFYGVLEILSSLIPEYWTFLFLKFLSGFAISGQTAVVFVYLNEFQPCKYSELLMSCMEAAWSIGLIILPFVAWIIIPLEISYRLGIFFFRSWNLFILICSLPSLLLGVCMYFSYETPKFLAQTGQTEQLLELLGTMYSQNTGNPSDQYFKEIAKSDNSAREMLNLSKNGNYENDQQNKEVASISVNKMITDILTQTTLLFKNPYLTRTLKLVILAYFITSSYYALMYWFPELFQRFLTFEIHNMNETANICIISEYWRDFKNTKNETLISMKNVIDCQRSIHNDLFYHTLYLGLGCLPLSIILPLTIKYVGYKSYLSMCSMLSAAATIGFFSRSTSTGNVVLSCFFEAFSSVCLSVIFCIIADIYPTNLRVIATSLVAIVGRLGALAGNSLFGYLIDDYCVPLYIMMGVEFFACSVLAIFLPQKTKA